MPVNNPAPSYISPNQVCKGSIRTMSHKQDPKLTDALSATETPGDVAQQDPLADTSPLLSPEVPAGVDRRNFLIRSAVGGAAAVMTGRLISAEERTAMAVATMPQQAPAVKPVAPAD